MKKVFENFPFLIKTHIADFVEARPRITEIILNEYFNWKRQKGIHNFQVQSTDIFFKQLQGRFHFECLKYFNKFTLDDESPPSCYAYVQNCEDNSAIWHDHLKTSTISGVYYLSVPNDGGEIWFLYRNKIKKVIPEEGHLYAFPRWLLHKPVAQKSDRYRISLNVEIVTNEYLRPRDGSWRW